MLVIGMFLAVVVLNYGGYIDKIYRANIDSTIMAMARSMTDISGKEKEQLLSQVQFYMEDAYGLNQPFILRCLDWTFDALTLQLGSAGRQETLSSQPTTVVKMIILDRLPYTLLLFGISNLVIFITSISLALYIYRKYEGFLDRLIIFLSPLSSIPSWLHGVFLVILFAAVLHVLPFPRTLNQGLGTYVKANLGMLLRYMILPVAAIFLNLFFQSVYSWRTFFLLHAGDDYLELAKAKGVPDKEIERRYLIRPSLPYILTSFAMTMLGIWQAALILEKFFFWPGIGSLFFDSLGNFPYTGGIIALFAYLLVFTIFLLDILYALVDPRVRITGFESTKIVTHTRRVSYRKWLNEKFLFARKRDHFPSPSDRWRNRVEDEDLSTPTDGKKRFRSPSALKTSLVEIRRYPAAMVGSMIIASLIFVSIYTVIAIPYKKALIQWRGDGDIWINNPKFAQPVWSNWFRKDKLPTTLIQDSRNGSASKMVKVESDAMRSVTIDFTIDYPFGGFPQDLVLNIDTENVVKRPLINLLWLTPDGREVELDNFSMTSAHRYSFEYQWYHDTQSILEIRSGPPPWEELFVATGEKEGKVLQGTYVLRLQGYVFDEDADLNAEMVLYGKVHGLAGTDDQRRDMILAILWGTPFALLFGLLGAFGTGLLAMILAATSVWFGGWVDVIIQRITEINMLLPALPLAIMIYFIYTHNIWIILGVIILLSVFGNALKNFRAAFMQAKEAGYIEAAQVYSAGSWRIILRYMVPKIIPLLVPQLVALVPSYIFLEPTLAFVGVVDPLLPTWGKVLMTGLYTAQENNVIYYLNLMRNPYLALEPIGLMFLTGLAFSLLGMALDRIFNPRLRSL